MPNLDALRRSNREVLQRVNREVSLRASRFSTALLSGVFRAIFRIEKAYEFSEPEVFQLDHEPERILWSRLDEYRMGHLDLAIANEEILASRYQLFTEYDFVVAVDISQSMVLDWWGIYGGQEIGGAPKPPRSSPGNDGDRTKLFLLKYTLASFLYAAQANEFYSYALLFGGNQIEETDSRLEPHLEENLLERIDGHFGRLVRRPVTESSRLCEALRRILARRRRAIVLVISDFADTLARAHEAEPAVRPSDAVFLLAEIAAHHRVLVLHLNDVLELFPQIEEHHPACNKNSAYVNPETCGEVRLARFSERDLRELGARAPAWADDFHRALAHFGIKFKHLIAGKNDADVDRGIYELGLATGA